MKRQWCLFSWWLAPPHLQLRLDIKQILWLCFTNERCNQSHPFPGYWPWRVPVWRFLEIWVTLDGHFHGGHLPPCVCTICHCWIWGSLGSDGSILGEVWSNSVVWSWLGDACSLSREAFVLTLVVPYNGVFAFSGVEDGPVPMSCIARLLCNDCNQCMLTTLSSSHFTMLWLRIWCSPTDCIEPTKPPVGWVIHKLVWCCRLEFLLSVIPTKKHHNLHLL